MRLSIHSVALVFGVLLGGCGESAETGEPAFNGVHPDDCIAGTEGVQRGECEGLRFDLHAPPECLERACGLILDVHGATMTGAQQEANTSLGELARGRGYLVLQPWAPDAWWDVSMYALDAQVLALAARVMQVFEVDERRVHMTGFSQGGFMTWRMLCRQPDLFASFAPLAADGMNVLRADTQDPCVGAGTTLLAPRPVYYAHGEADAIVGISGANETIDALRNAWGLARPELIGAGEHYEIFRYSSGGTGMVEHMQHSLRSNYVDESFGAWEGHCFPGSDAPMGCGAGPAWGEAVLRFFEAHPKD